MTGVAGEQRPLVIGIGNRLRGDDGAGPTVIDLIRARYGDTLATAVAAGDLSDLAICWEPDQEVVIVDAMVIGRTPGTVTVLDGPAARTVTGPDRLLSSHGVGLADAIALARAIGRLPSSLTIVGIEGQSFEPGDPLSEPVRAAVTLTADRIAELTSRREAVADQI